MSRVIDPREQHAKRLRQGTERVVTMDVTRAPFLRAVFFGGCFEPRCNAPCEWSIQTMAGEQRYCGPHAQWYLDKGADIYPARRMS
jgi:hypothetical protein